jgi:hypothetical protein
MQRCSTTSLNANPWLLPSADGTEQRADRWEDLDWDMAADGAKARQVEVRTVHLNTTKHNHFY